MHNFTKFAIELNELEDGIPPTDSRLRPDQRLMEEGKWPQANELKQKLEEAQRERRKKRDENEMGNILQTLIKHFFEITPFFVVHRNFPVHLIWIENRNSPARIENRISWISVRTENHAETVLKIRKPKLT